MTHRIRNQLSIATAALVLGVSALLLGVVYWATLSTLERDANDAVNEELHSLVERWQEGGLPGLIAEVEKRSYRPENQGLSYLVTQEERQWVAGNIRVWPKDYSPEAPATGASVDVRQADVWLVKHIHLASVRVGEHHLLVGRDLTHHDTLRVALEASVLGGLGLAALLAVAAGLMVGRSLVGRVDKMRDKIDAILGGAHSERVPVGPSGDEFDELASLFNRLLNENDRLLSQVREVTNNIAHDLRTPLQRIHVRLEAVLATAPESEIRQIVEAVSDDTDRLLETFNGLLQIAHVESDDLRRGMLPTKVNSLISDIADLYAPLAEDSGVALGVEVERDLVVLAQRQLLGQALANLVDNAIKYGPDGHAILIEARRRAGKIILSVSDHGPGIPEADRARVLERLVRLDSARTVPGTGLGLSFVASVARLHGSELTLRDNAPGLRVEITLSQAPHEDGTEDTVDQETDITLPKPRTRS